MTRLWCVRHGPTHARTMVGWSDLPADLSDTGAIERLRAELPATAPVVSSDLTRARTTADALQGNRPRLADDPDLREMHFGAWELRHFAEIEAEDADRIRAFWEHPGDVRPPGGESWHQIVRRVDCAIDRLLSLGHPDIIVVAHFGAILTQVQRALAIDAYEAFSHRLEPLSLTEIDTAADPWAVSRINHRP